MIAIPKEKTHDVVPAWHQAFLAMLPQICRHAAIAFRDLDAEACDEAVAEVVANALVAYRRLVELDKADLAYPSVLARYGVAQTKTGRKVGGKLNSRDVLARYARIKNKITVERLDRYDREEQGWQEIVVEDRHAGPALVAATRIDFRAWLESLTSRQRAIAGLLATGESTKAVAQKFGLTDGRISQVRRELMAAWRGFTAEKPTAGSTAAAG